MSTKSPDYFNKLTQILTLSHESLYTFALPEKTRNPALLLKFVDSSTATSDMIQDRIRQQRARFMCAILMMFFGVFAYAFKFSAAQMFYYLQSSLSCSTSSFVNNCFSNVMIYRMSFTIVIYHSVMFFINLYPSSETSFINDFCWLFKALLFSEFFFVMCLVPNSVFSQFAVGAKYVAMIFIIIKIMILSDAAYYYFDRHTLRGNPYSKKKNLDTAEGDRSGCRAEHWGLAFGVILVLLGLASFVFIYVDVKTTCTQYLAVNSVLLGFTVVFAVVHTIRNCFKAQFISGLFIVFIFGAASWGLVFGTPFSPCVSTFNANLNFMKITAHVDTVVRELIRVVVVSFVACIFIGCESQKYEECDAEQGFVSISICFGEC